LGISRVISPFVPEPLREPARQIRNYLIYEFGVRVMRRDPFVPPPQLHPVGSGDYRATGKEFFGYFTTLAGLTPKDRVLDIGCGTGRMALPLTQYVDGGTYDGLDIAKPAINWCRRIYTRRYPNFRFHYIDLYSELYNRRGKQRSERLQLPFEEQTFDFVFLTSVFTHMSAAEAIRNYLSEITRVMKPGARCFATFFLITPESQQLMKSGAADFEFISADGCYVADPKYVENAVGYDETLVRELYERHGLHIAEPIHYGRWCGRKDGLSYQDILIATK